MTIQLKTTAAVGAMLCALTTMATAQDADNDGIWQVADFTCRDMLIRSGSERDFVMIYMHGFMSGKMGEMTFDAPALTAATDAVLGACIDNPDQPLMTAFEAARG
mgnify:FL=1